MRIQLEVMEVQYTITQTDHVSSKVIRLHFDERFCHNCCRHTADLLRTAVDAQFFTQRVVDQCIKFIGRETFIVATVELIDLLPLSAQGHAVQQDLRQFHV